jgi:Spy/CpxP family protein refolding chaperone
MNRIHLTAGVATLALAIVALSAQGQPRPDRRPEAAPEFGPPSRVLERLELTQDQKKKIEALVKEFSDKHKGDVEKVREEMGKLREEAGKGGREGIEKARKRMEDLTAGLRKLEDDLDSQIAAQLNADHRKKFEEAKKELTGGNPKGERPGERKGDRPEGRPGERKGDRPEGRPGERKGDRPDVGKGPGGGVAPMILMIPGMADRLGLSAEQKEKLAKLRKEFDDKTMDVLTAEQKKQLEEMRGRFPGRGGRPGPGGPPERPERGKDKDGKEKDKGKTREF